MRMPLLILALLSLASAACTQRRTATLDDALAKRIDGWVETFLTANDGAVLGPLFEDAESVYRRQGIPSIATVGDAGAYGFVFINSLGLPPDTRSEFLAKVAEATARHDLPEDALLYAQAKARQLEVEERYQTHTPSNPKLRDEIVTLHQRDQAVRQKEGFDQQKMLQTDRELSGPLKAILDRHGVPTFDMVGVEPSKNFVVMLQHQKPEFRQAELPLLKANVDAGQGDPGIYAMVFDGTRLDQNRDQFYGERLECAPEGVLRPAPIEDRPNVNFRRAKLGLLRLELQVRWIVIHNAVPCNPASPVPSNPKQ